MYAFIIRIILLMFTHLQERIVKMHQLSNTSLIICNCICFAFLLLHRVYEVMILKNNTRHQRDM